MAMTLRGMSPTITNDNIILWYNTIRELFEVVMPNHNNVSSKYNFPTSFEKQKAVK